MFGLFEIKFGKNNRSTRYMICKPIDTHANEIYPLNEKKKNVH